MHKKILAFACLGTIVMMSAFLLQSMIRYVWENYLPSLSATVMDHADTADMVIDNIAMDETVVEESNTAGQMASRFAKGLECMEAAAKMKRMANAQINELATENQLVMNIFSFLQRMMDKRYIPGDSPETNVAKLDNGHLVFIYEDAGENEAASYWPGQIPQMAENMIWLKEYAENKNIDFLFLLAPCKIDETQKLLPVGLEDMTNEIANQFLAGVEGKVDYIDLRKEIRNEDLDHYDMFFVTDHHWKPEAGLWAFGKTAAHLNKIYGFDIDEALWNTGNFDFDRKENICLGSQGIRVGAPYGGLDDIVLISPRFQTKFEMGLPYKNTYISGDFAEVMFNKEAVHAEGFVDLLPDYAYNTGGIIPLQTIKNSYSTNNKKILLVRDSFASAYAPFLSLSCAELDSIDLRRFTGSLVEYVDETNPDIIIFLYNVNAVRSQDMFQFK